VNEFRHFMDDPFLQLRKNNAFLSIFWFKLKFCLKKLSFLITAKFVDVPLKLAFLVSAPLLRYCTVHTNNRAITKIHHPDFINTEKRSGGQETPKKVGSAKGVGRKICRWGLTEKQDRLLLLYQYHT